MPEEGHDLRPVIRVDWKRNALEACGFRFGHSVEWGRVKSKLGKLVRRIISRR